MAVGKYDDLLDRARWEPSARHPRMAVAVRAKIFMPFASLRGFGAEITEQEVRLLPKPLPSAEETQEMDRRLNRLQAMLAAGVRPPVRLTLFEETEPGFGRAVTLEGRARRIDPAQGLLQLEHGEAALAAMTGLEILAPENG